MVKWKYYKLRANRSGLNRVLPFITCTILDKALLSKMGWVLESTAELGLF